VAVKLPGSGGDIFRGVMLFNGILTTEFGAARGFCSSAGPVCGGWWWLLVSRDRRIDIWLAGVGSGDDAGVGMNEKSAMRTGKGF